MAKRYESVAVPRVFNLSAISLGTSVSAAMSDPLAHLPLDMWESIFSYLDPVALASVSRIESFSCNCR